MERRRIFQILLPLSFLALALGLFFRSSLLEAPKVQSNGNSPLKSWVKSAAPLLLPIPQTPLRPASERKPASATRLNESRQTWQSADDSKLLEFVEKNELCSLLESKLSPKAPPELLFSLLQSTPGKRSGPIPFEVIEAYMRALNAENETDFRAHLRSVQHPMLRLTEATALLGLLAGKIPPVARDPRAAVPILRALAAEVPSNAVPALFLAHALRENHESKAAVAELERALLVPGFNTYLEETMQSIYVRSLERPVLMPAALAITEQAPVPDLLPAVKMILEELVEADRTFAENALAFGQSLVAREKSRSARTEFLFWSALNYRLGQQVAQASWKKIYPGLPYSEDLSVPLQTLFARNHLASQSSDLVFAEHFNREHCESAMPIFAFQLNKEWESAASERAQNPAYFR